MTKFHVRALGAVARKPRADKKRSLKKTVNVAMYVSAKDERSALRIVRNRMLRKHDADVIRAVVLPVL